MRRGIPLRALSLLAIGLAAGLTAFVATAALTGNGSAPAPVKAQAPEGPGSMTAQERAQRFQPGPPWDGRGKGPWTRAEIEAFGEYPLLWLGESFAGYHLQWVGRVKYTAPSGRAQDMVTFIYGVCTPEGDAARCPAPVTVHVRPICQVQPQHVAERAKAGPPETVRMNARLQRFADGSLLLWTGSVVVSIVPMADPSLADQALQQLRGVGRLGGGLGAGRSLRPPDFSGC